MDEYYTHGNWVFDMSSVVEKLMLQKLLNMLIMYDGE